MSICRVLRHYGGEDVAAQVGNPHFIQAFNPLDVGNINYQGRESEVRGRG